MTKYVAFDEEYVFPITEGEARKRWRGWPNEPHVYELGPEVKEPDTIILQPGALDALMEDLANAGFEVRHSGTTLTWVRAKS